MGRKSKPQVAVVGDANDAPNKLLNIKNLGNLKMQTKTQERLTESELKARNDAIDEVLELLRIHPPSRIGEAAFIRRLVNLKTRQ